MNVEFAFIECPTRLDPDRAFVVSGHRLTSKKLDVFPFEFGVSLFLDERSQKLLGMETVTVSETELVTDCVDTPCFGVLTRNHHRRQISSDYSIPDFDGSKTDEYR